MCILMSCNLCSCVQYGSDGDLSGRNYECEGDDVANSNANLSDKEVLFHKFAAFCIIVFA